MSCRELDGQVAVPSDDELRKLLDQYVCVRMVQMHGVDLKKFAFDGSLTWAVFLMNADGTMYARYGSRSGLNKLSEREISVDGFKKTLRGGVELHRRYSQDKDGLGARLKAKTHGIPPPWATPDAIPTLNANPRFKDPFIGESGKQAGCIHCHMVPMNEIKSLRDANKKIPDRAFVPFPMPNQLGFRMDPKEMATVLNVHPNSLAGRAGLKKGDRILSIDDQPILSTADIQWVLHNADDEDKLAIKLARGDQVTSLDFELKQGWRLLLNDWRFINKGLLRQAIGFNVDMMPRQRARRIGLKGKMCLVVDKTTRDARMKTGIGNKNLIVAIDGNRDVMTVGAFTAYVLRTKKSGDKLKITIMQLSDRFPRPEHDVEVTIR